MCICPTRSPKSQIPGIHRALNKSDIGLSEQGKLFNARDDPMRVQFNDRVNRLSTDEIIRLGPTQTGSASRGGATVKFEKVSIGSLRGILGNTQNGGTILSISLNRVLTTMSWPLYSNVTWRRMIKGRLVILWGTKTKCGRDSTEGMGTLID